MPADSPHPDDTASLLLGAARVDALRVVGADTMHAFELICTASMAEGAIPRHIKLLFASVIAAIKGGARNAEAPLQAAADAGLTVDEAAGAASVLTASRGGLASTEFSAAITTVFGDQPPAEPRSTPAEPQPDPLAYFEAAYDELPDRIRLIVNDAPQLLEGFHRLRSAGLGHAGLSRMHRELLLVAINSAFYEEAFVASHARDARNAGATEAALAEAVATAIPFAGLAAWRPGAGGVTQSRQTDKRP